MFAKKYEDIKGVIRSRKSNDRRQYNDQIKKDKSNNDQHNTTQKTRDYAPDQHIHGSYLRCSRKMNSSCSFSDTRYLLLELKQSDKN